MNNTLQTLLDMGLLRNMLHVTALAFAALMPFAGGPQYSDDWNLFFSGILPATAPLIVIVIGLDIMMSAIWKSDATPERVDQLSGIIRAHQIFGGILLLAWLAVFLPALI
jgi:hypothetical protein